MKASDLFAGGVWCQACLPAVPYGRGHSQPGSLFIHFGAISVLPDADWAPLNTACASFPSDSRIVQVLANGATASVTEDAERPLGMGHLLRRRRYQQQMITSGDKFDTCPLGSTPEKSRSTWHEVPAENDRRPRRACSQRGRFAFSVDPAKRERRTAIGATTWEVDRG